MGSKWFYDDCSDSANLIWMDTLACGHGTSNDSFQTVLCGNGSNRLICCRLFMRVQQGSLFVGRLHVPRLLIWFCLCELLVRPKLCFHHFFHDLIKARRGRDRRITHYHVGQTSKRLYLKRLTITSEDLSEHNCSNVVVVGFKPAISCDQSVVCCLND